jgi:hypothetical protein
MTRFTAGSVAGGSIDGVNFRMGNEVNWSLRGLTPEYR